MHSRLPGRCVPRQRWSKLSYAFKWNAVQRVLNLREYGFLFLLVASNEKRGRKLLNGCQQALHADDRALVAHRYSTRSSAEAYEVGLSETEFDARNEFGCFVLDWAHRGVNYALGVEVDRWLDGGLNVVCLAAPGAIEAARRRWRHHVRVVYAPGASSSPLWLRRLGTERAGTQQLGFGFGPGQAAATDGLSLDTNLDLATRQLSGWLRLSRPPAMVAA